MARFRELIQPYIERARETYPDAKARWQRGLPDGETFFLTTIFRHSEHAIEQVFVEVIDIKDGRVSGLISSEPMGPGFRQWQPYEFSEGEVLDWTIQRKDGTEEGNLVGKFTDRYPGRCPE